MLCVAHPQFVTYFYAPTKPEREKNPCKSRNRTKQPPVCTLLLNHRIDASKIVNVALAFFIITLPRPLHRETLERPNSGNHRAPEPRDGCAVDLAPRRIQVPRNRWRHHPARSARARRQPVDFPKGFAARRCLLNEDEEEGVQDDGEDVADREAEVNGWVEKGVRDVEEARDDHVDDWVEDRYEEEEAVDPDLLGRNREDDGLDEKSDDAVDSHDYTHGPYRHSQSAGSVQE